MSKKKLVNKKLRKGRFYLVHDGSKTGHPGMIVWKNDNKNLYLSLTTETTYNKDLIRLSHSTDKSTHISYVHKRPFLGRRKDYGSKEMTDMKFNKYDKKRILRKIIRNKPRYSSNINRKGERYYLKASRRKMIKY